MTTTAVGGAVDTQRPVPGSRVVHPLSQAVALAQRSVRATVRQPGVWLPSLLFPMLIAAVNNSAMARAVNLPGFPPVDSFLQFVLPATIVQGVMFGAISGGSDLALDIEDGFFERLLASPVWRPSILVGRLSGGAVLGAGQALIFVGLFALFGAHVEGGIPAVLTLMVMAMLVALMIGGFTAAVGVRTGNQEAVQASFPLVFILLFISSAFFPTDLMGGWYEWVAERNPITWMIDAARHLVIVGFDPAEAATALAVPAAIAVLSISLAVHQLRGRLARSG
jgi:ABC-2 type transport system permease protein